MIVLSKSKNEASFLVLIAFWSLSLGKVGVGYWILNLTLFNLIILALNGWGRINPKIVGGWRWNKRASSSQKEKEGWIA